MNNALKFLAGTIGAAAAITGLAMVPRQASAHESLKGRDVTVWLMNQKLKEAVGTPFLYSCTLDKDRDYGALEVTCWGAPSSLY